VALSQRRLYELHRVEGAVALHFVGVDFLGDKASQELKLLILNLAGLVLPVDELLPFRDVPLPDGKVILNTHCGMEIAKEVSVRHHEEFVTAELNNSAHVLSNIEVFLVPLVKVAVTLVNQLNFSESKLIVIIWLWRVKLVPHSDVEPVDVVVATKSDGRDGQHPKFTLKVREDELCPHRKDVGETCHRVEGEEDSMLAEHILGAVLASDGDDQCENHEDHDREVDDWELSCRLTLGSFKVLSVACWASTYASLIEQEQRLHADLAELLVFKQALLASTDATKASLVIFIGDCLKRAHLEAASSEVVLQGILISLSTGLASCYFMPASAAR